MPGRKKDIYWSLALTLYCAAGESFLYGVYVVLFWFCIKALRGSNIPYRRSLTVAVSVIFCSSTFHVVLQLVNAAELMLELLHHSCLAPREWDKINIAMGALYITNNLIADGIFIYRCYCIWDRSKRIIVVPILFLITAGGLGYASVITCGMDDIAEFLFITWLFPLSLTFSVLTNVLLMALTAGRIWWIARGAREIMGPEVVKQYRTVVAMILESGALYVTPGVLYLMFMGIAPSSTVVIFAALAQIVGIAPTIIVLRVGRGKTVDSVDSFRAGGDPEDDKVLHLRPLSGKPNFLEMV
ncbi:hypothetical protein FB45DRAFT_919503 [Roridomyces roridus]|uniref:Uncharacterized protein n=1 Tax=Roridomyces roridus TaxID=1738132 RepID=A0AAD7BSC2_9AGAR|nr:hypothetical protein FB45DRAFT_919503 [Roridomyces roridus]